MVYEYKTGPISATGEGIIDGLSFQYFGAGMYLSLKYFEIIRKSRDLRRRNRSRAAAARL